jgi:hypothetical protein
MFTMPVEPPPAGAGLFLVAGLTFTSPLEVLFAEAVDRVMNHKKPRYPFEIRGFDNQSIGPSAV